MAVNPMTLPENTYVIGKIPGYNSNIDANRKFEKELLKGVTFIDLRPTSYIFSEQGNNLDSLTEFFNTLKNLGNLNSLFTTSNTISKKVFHSVLERMQADFNLSENFKQTDMIRIVAANDSTFTETFSNNFSGDNMVNSALSTAANSKPGNMVKFLGKGIKSYSHESMLSVVSGINSAGVSNGLSTIGSLSSGIMAGMTLATPSTWENSSYSSTLSVFIKLVAPTGTDNDIRDNIIEPIMMMLAAASPITYNGIMYGLPLLWDVHAHGITKFKLGAIGAMTLIRGSFETTFTKNLQPTVVDVRLALIPILNDFATQPAGVSTNDIYTDVNYLGLQTPGDINTGITNNTGNLAPVTDPRGGDQILTIKL